MEVDVVSHRVLGCLGGQVSGPLERFDPPRLDQLGLVGTEVEFCRRHA